MTTKAAIALNSKVRLTDSVLMEDLAGEAILLDLASEDYFALDLVGTRILSVLNEVNSIQAAYEVLLSEYAVEPEELKQDLLEYVQELRQDGLVEVTSA